MIKSNSLASMVLQHGKVSSISGLSFSRAMNVKKKLIRSNTIAVKKTYTDLLNRTLLQILTALSQAMIVMKDHGL